MALPILAASVLFAFFFAFWALARTRQIENIATSDIRSAPQGYVELEGTGLPLSGKPERSPLSGTECLWWEFDIARRRGGRWIRLDGWTSIERKTSTAPFLLRDATGTCRIDPNGAMVEPQEIFDWYGDSERPAAGPPKVRPRKPRGRYHYIERLILPQTQLYVIGQFRTLDGTQEGEPNHVLGHSTIKGQPFLIAGHPQADIVRRLRLSAGVFFAWVLIGGILVIWMLLDYGFLSGPAF